MHLKRFSIITCGILIPITTHKATRKQTNKQTNKKQNTKQKPKQKKKQTNKQTNKQTKKQTKKQKTKTKKQNKNGRTCQVGSAGRAFCLFVCFLSYGSNSQNIVLINNSRTAGPTSCYFEFLGQFNTGCKFKKKNDNFEIQYKTC